MSTMCSSGARIARFTHIPCHARLGGQRGCMRRFLGRKKDGLDDLSPR